MTVSVVVPTRGRSEALARCRRALAAQTSEVEVVVVEDESGRGPAWARNAGVARAGGEVICFTDDDCEPKPGWAGALAAAALAEGAASGPVLAPPDANVFVRAAQTVISYLQESSLDPVSGRLGFAPTCNLAMTREAAEALPFDESFPAAAGEDREWTDRAVAAGSAPIWVPEAVVVHRQSSGFRGFLRRQFAYGRGGERYRGKRGAGLPRVGFYLGLVREGFRGGPIAGALVCVAQLATAAGAVAERLRGDASTSEYAGRT